ncbi:unnamed protein product [Kuraishia capsulata CBS 1993]|uniref:UBX domain-containing protein n=1 Tax=Kuraishia capsulata CBS 1993 TaxID=1382522 RepID=W6MK94_9ASCO|nr:uncharacterized protein KUCA_T00002745001 [Kuraishia capsulata CBS 1993]CDK26771.1 unnamed protein product [Kuraishia capsulata CBS 1993]
MTSHDFYMPEIESAIARSLTERKVLLIYLSPNSTAQDTWEYDRIRHNQNAEVSRRILLETVRLKLVKDTQGFNYFQQIFPGITVPSCYLLLGSRVLEVISESINVEAFNEKVLQVLDGHMEAREPSADIVANQSEQPQEQFPTPAETTLEPEVASPERQRASKKPKVCSDPAKIPKAKKILADQVNSKSLVKESPTQKPNTSLQTERPHENIHNESLETSHDFAIQFKLFDGSVLRASFENNDTLAHVRNWIISERQEYESDYFCFYKPIDRITYSEEDENLTLKDLKLNRANLILKPMDPGESSSHNSVGQTGTYGVSWLKTEFFKIGSFLGFSGKKEPEMPADDVVAEGSSFKADPEISEDVSAYPSSLEASSGSTRCSSPHESERPALHFNSSTSQFSLNGPSSNKLVISPTEEVSVDPVVQPSNLRPSSRTEFTNNTDEERKTYNGNSLEVKDENKVWGNMEDS